MIPVLNAVVVLFGAVSTLGVGGYALGLAFGALSRRREAEVVAGVRRLSAPATVHLTRSWTVRT